MPDWTKFELPDAPERDLTPGQRRDLAGLRIMGWTVRGMQISFILAGAYGTFFGGRGGGAIGICLLIAWALQTQLPARPEWLEKLRDRDTRY